MNNQPIELTTDLLCFRLMGIYDKTLHFFDAGYYSGNEAVLGQCLVVRLHDPNGHSLGYMGQRLTQWARAQYGLWKMAAGITEAPCLFNMHRIEQQSRQPLIITSSPWMVMKLFQAGYERSVALISLTLSEELTRYITLLDARQAYLFLGGDRGSRAAALWIENHVIKTVRSIYLPDGVLPEQLCEEHIKEFLGPYFTTDNE